MVLFAWVDTIVKPCFSCESLCGDEYDASLCKRQRAKRPFRKSVPLSSQAGLQRIELVCSALAGLRGAAGYHTSVLIDGEEYYFSPAGIRVCPRLMSHGRLPSMKVTFIGKSPLTGTDLLRCLSAYFQPGTYDLLKKNCNNFTDCALLLLTGERLQETFRAMEMFGLVIEQTVGLMQAVSGGRYLPNKQAESYDHEAVIEYVSLFREELLPRSLNDEEEGYVSEATI